ncbi:MAG: branched-chain amino acid ABC transporter permease [Gammaproteobacteria bacterium]|nr:branched-chain amino acid ABC transporter permease [Gammaproteobacteria bacterium]MYF38185.1 branched-chain amino acid ABC transporter permease [Gammaproteobacteria bacterium]
MRFVLKTNYHRDVDLFRDKFQFCWFAVLLVFVLSLPMFTGTYVESQLTLVFLWSIAGAGLMILVGYTGLISLGHAAFLSVGAYTHAILLDLGVPPFVSIPSAMLLCSVLGVVVSIAALRMTGIYLAIATLAFAMIVEKVVKNWSSVTGGNAGFKVAPPEIFGWELNSTAYYYLCLLVLTLVMLGVSNLLRAPTGRAFIAVRDSEISAQATGINLVKTKALAFAVSAALAGLAGTLLAYQWHYLFPDSFSMITSIKLLMLVIIGGLGSMSGVIFGAIFMTLLPDGIATVREWLPDSIGNLPGLEPFSFGLILILFLIFEPRGISGRWQKIRLFFSQFPLYRNRTFRRQKSFLRTERVH